MTENSTPWTEGAWSYRSQELDDWGIVRVGKRIICQARDPRVTQEDESRARREDFDPYEANARLIAAAPDLAHALQMVGQWIKAVDRTPITAAHNMADAYRLYALPALQAARALPPTDAEGE